MRRLILLGLVPAVLAAYAFEALTLRNQWTNSTGPDYWEIQRHRILGVDAYPYSAPMAWYVRPRRTMAIAGREAVPLFSIARKFSVLCREGTRPFAAFATDRYGYNNPDSVWNSAIEIVALGDSFTVGACVDPRDHDVTLIRDRFPRLANLGASGSGPIMQIAILREFLPAIRPKLVIWFYDEHNDVFVADAPPERTDLWIEHDHPVLGRYFKEPAFRQDVIANMSLFQAALKTDIDRLMEDYRRQGWSKAPDALLDFISLRATRQRLKEGRFQIGALFLGVAHAQEEDLRIRLFEAAMRMMMDEARAAGARMLVVKLPSYNVLCGRTRHPLADAVEKIIADSGAEFLDTEPALRQASQRDPPSDVFALPCGGHYSELGNQAIAQVVIERLRAFGGLTESNGTP